MHFRIHNISQVFLYLFVFAISFSLIFKTFHYYYEDNYCDVLSWVVIENSKEEYKAMKACVSTLLCEIWDVSRKVYERSDNDLSIIKKDFSCIRKNKPWVWK